MLIRPPYGAATPAQKAMIKELGYQLVFWSVDPEDWKGHKKASEISNFLSQKVTDGQIVLAHDIHERTVDAMKILLPKLKDKFKLVTVGDLNRETTHTPHVKIHH